MHHAFSRRQTLTQAAALAASMTIGKASYAQSFPSRPISWIVPFPAGGSADFAARALAGEMSKLLNQPIQVENASGGGGLVGMTRAANAPADGHTIYYGTPEVIVPPLVNPKITHDWKKIFRPIGLILQVPLVLVARSEAPYSTLDELTAYARSNPGKITYASTGVGTAQHFAGEMMRERGKIAIVHIPYRGGPQIVTDLLGGQIDMAFLVGSTAMPHLKKGSIKALGVIDANPNATLPGIPTFNSNKLYVGMVLNPFAGMFVPIQTPQAAVDRLDQSLRTALQNDEVRRKLIESGATVKHLGPNDLTVFLDNEQLKYKRIVNFANIRLKE
jgi:tripartite-type tricarboxylate transporter receptor subunit TctC